MRAPLAFVAAAFGFGIGLAWWLHPSLLLLRGLLLIAGVGLLQARDRPAMANLCLLALVGILGIFRAAGDAQVPVCSIARVLSEDPQPMTWRSEMVRPPLAAAMTWRSEMVRPPLAAAMTCEGMVVSDVEWIHPAQGPARRQGWFQITRIRNGGGWISSNGRVLLRLHAHNVPLAYGDHVRFSGSIRGPRPIVRGTDGGGRKFDEGNWLWIHGASGMLTITNSEAITRLDTIPSLWIQYRRWVASFRWQSKQLGCSLLGPLEVAYLEAFLLGDGRGIPREVWDAFRKVGIVHVLVVSGLHVGLIASIGLIGLSLIRIPRALRYHLLGAGLITYCLLTGGNPPILRAAIMGVLLCLGRAAGRDVPVLNSLGLAALLILTTNPRALADVSFQLSFAAVLGLFTLSPWFAKWFKVDDESEATDPLGKMHPTPESETVIQRWRRTLLRWMAQGFAASCGAWVAISPVVAWHFHMFTPIALIANLIVIPWTSLLIVIGLLVYSIGWINPVMATPFAVSFSWLVYGLNRLVIWSATLPGASWKW